MITRIGKWWTGRVRRRDIRRLNMELDDKRLALAMAERAGHPDAVQLDLRDQIADVEQRLVARRSAP